MEKMKGIFPALVTPLREDGSIAQDALEKIIEVNLQKGVTGFYVGGSTGESYLLSMVERKELIEKIVGIVNGRGKVIANIGVFATCHGIEMAKTAESLGVDAISAVPPFYFKFSMDELIQYYNDIAEAVSVPMIVYNIPAMSGVSFSSEQIEKLLSNDRIAGMKHTSFDLFQLQRVIREYPEKSIFIGHDEIFLSAYSIGAEAAIGSTFNFMAEKFVKMAALFKEKKMEEALDIQNQVNQVVEVLSEIGVFKGIKAALELQGIDCGVCRKPFQPLKKEQIEKLRTVMELTGCL